MSLPPRPAPADARPDHVLLEQWVTFCGRQLELRVTTADAASPDTVAVHVRYGSDQAGLVVRADGDPGASEASGSPAGAVGALHQTPSPGRVVSKRPEGTSLSFSREQKAELKDVGTCGRATEQTEMTYTRGSEDDHMTPLDAVIVKLTVDSATGREETTSSRSGGERQDQVPLATVNTSGPATPNMKNTRASAGPAERGQHVAPPTEGAQPMESAKKDLDSGLCRSAQRQELAAMSASSSGQDSGHQSQARETSEEAQNLKETPLKKPPVQQSASQSGGIRKEPCYTKSSQPLPTDLEKSLVLFSRNMQIPKTILRRILSFLIWRQLNGVRRVSKSWRDAAEDCLAGYRELHIRSHDFPAALDDASLEKLLRAMPALRRLSVEWRLDREKLDVDIVSQHCRNLVEIDLTRFRLDTWSLQQLCAACPKLEVVKLPRKCDDSCVDVLLRNLPQLRSLDLEHTNVTGQFLAQANDSVEKLSLASCAKLKFENLRMMHLLTVDPQKRVICWKQLRELDLSSTTISSADIADVFKHFPQLVRLSFAHCSKIESTSLLQLAFCERLRDLDVSHVGPLQAANLLMVLTRCSKLERLVLAGCKVQGQLSLGNCDLRLRELDVSTVHGMAMADLIAILARSPHLQILRTPGFEKMELNACLTQLKKCTDMRNLDVSHPGVDFQKKFVDYAALSSLLLSCQKLEKLLLKGCHISESASLRQLAKCPNLQELDLSSATALEAADLAQGLSGCPLLRRLSLAGLNAPLEQLVPPSGLPELIYLDVSRSGLTNNSLRRLRGLCPRLQTLNMMECRRVKRDAMEAYLPRLPHLRYLISDPS